MWKSKGFWQTTLDSNLFIPIKYWVFFDVAVMTVTLEFFFKLTQWKFTVM